MRCSRDPSDPHCRTHCRTHCSLPYLLPLAFLVMPRPDVPLPAPRTSKTWRQRLLLPVLACAVVFLSSFVFGAIQGHGQRAELINDSIIERITYPPDQSGKLDFIFVCKGNANVMYSMIDAGVISPSGVPPPQFDLLDSLTPHKAFVLWLVGGTSASVSFASFFSAARAAAASEMETGGQKFLNAMASVISAISGYSLGYKFGTGGRPDCATRSVRDVVEDKDNWPEFVREYAQGLVYSMAVLFPKQYRPGQSGIDALLNGPVHTPLFACGFDWLPDPPILRKVEIKGAKLSGDDFTALLNFIEVFKRATALPEYQSFVAEAAERGVIGNLSITRPPPGYGNVFDYECFLDKAPSDATPCSVLTHTGRQRDSDVLRNELRYACTAVDTAFKSRFLGNRNTDPASDPQ